MSRPRGGPFRRWAQIFQFRSTPRYIPREIDAEIDFHLDERVEKLMGDGMSRHSAEREAQRQFGDLKRHRRDLVAIDRRRASMERRSRFLEATAQNIRYAARSLMQSKGFTATVVITLALGIGANATMFGVVDRLLLSPPAGVADPATVLRVYITRSLSPGRPYTSATLTHADFADWTAASTFDITAFTDRGITLGRGEEARRIVVSLVSVNFFDVLGVDTPNGRFFTDREDSERAEVIVISDAFRQSYFAGEEDVLGKTVHIGGYDLTVVGVAAPGFHGVNLGRVDAWLPLRTPANSSDPDDWETHRGYYWLRALLRLAPGSTIEAADAEATALHRAARAGTEYDPEALVSASPLVAARGPRASNDSKVAQWLAAVSVIVLLIACANVANLLLARAMRRRREIGVRLALGVSRARLVAQLVTESLMLSFLGAAGALLIAHWGAELMRAALLPDVYWPGSPLNVRILAFTFAAAVAAGLVAGLAPALQTSRPNLVEVLKGNARGGVLHRSRARTLLTVAQATLSVLLLVGAGLFVRSLLEVRGLDLGIDPDRVVLAMPEFTAGAMSEQDEKDFYRQALERLAVLPGVEVVASAASTPFMSSWAEELHIPGVEELPDLPTGGPYIMPSSPGIFEALDLRIVEGRGFRPGEGATSAPIAVIDETMAELIWPGDSALGNCLLLGPPENDPPCNEIVGVVESSHRQELIEEETMQYFVPLGQGYDVAPHTLFIRADPERFDTLIPGVRRELLGISGAVRFVVARPYRDYIDPQARAWQLGATMFTVFGILALAIAAVGLYGVLAFSIVQRTHEIGVRTALGASPGRLVHMVMTQALRLAAVGLAVGVAIALATGRWIAPLLFNVSARDPFVLAGVTAVLGAVAVLAAAIPAWRVTRVDPNLAFRSE